MLWRSVFIIKNGRFGFDTIEARLDPMNQPYAPNYVILDNIKFRLFSIWVHKNQGITPLYVEESSKSQEKFSFHLAKTKLKKMGFKPELGGKQTFA